MSATNERRLAPPGARPLIAEALTIIATEPKPVCQCDALILVARGVVPAGREIYAPLPRALLATCKVANGWKGDRRRARWPAAPHSLAFDDGRGTAGAKCTAALGEILHVCSFGAPQGHGKYVPARGLAIAQAGSTSREW